MRGAYRIIALAAGLIGYAPAHADVAYLIDTAAGSDLVGDGGAAASAQLSNAHGIVVDRQGNLYIADTDNHRIRKITPAGIDFDAGRKRPSWLLRRRGTGQPGAIELAVRSGDGCGG